jgi:peptidyl-tRNA hydrolase
MIKNGDKLYIVVRQDLKPGSQLAQACHASFLFASEFPDETKDWMTNSNHIVILGIKSEDELIKLIESAVDIKTAVFKEPDMNNQITAIALECNSLSKELCSKLKLALNG